MIKLQPGQDFLMPNATSRIFIHFIDQLFNRLFSVADNVTGHAFRGRNQFTVDN